MKKAKWYVAAFLAGVATPIAVGLYLGGETVAQAGFRLAAIENGVALASRHWQFEAVPEHEEVIVEARTEPPRPAPRKRR